MFEGALLCRASVEVLSLCHMEQRLGSECAVHETRHTHEQNPHPEQITHCPFSVQHKLIERVVLIVSCCPYVS